jgi:oxygen-dependent protoporphyrinogen oxidase
MSPGAGRVHDLVIVGGGISGLAAAHAAHQRGADFLLLEGGPRWGGVIRSEAVDGFLLEGGPDAILAQKPEGLALCRALGLGERLVPTNPHQRAVYVLHRGRLEPLPEGLLLAVPTRVWPFLRSRLFSWGGKLRMGLDVLLPARRARGDESIASFLRRRFGAEAVERLGEPLLAGIHAGDPERLSIACTFPRFVELEQRYGSLVRGMRKAPRAPAGQAASAGFYSLRGGLGELVDALVRALPGERLLRDTPLAALERDPDGFVLQLESGAAWRARQVIVAVPAHRAARLLAGLLPATAARLDAIPFASSATVLLGFKRADVSHPLDGYGMVIPAGEGLRLAAASFLSTKFPGRAPEGQVLLRGFLGGVRDPQVLTLDDAALVELVRRELGPVLGLRGEPTLTRVYRWPKGTPQMEVGHQERMAESERELAGIPGLFLIGSGLRGTGLPDCVADAARAVNTALGPSGPAAPGEP